MQGECDIRNSTSTAPYVLLLQSSSSRMKAICSPAAPNLETIHRLHQKCYTSIPLRATDLHDDRVQGRVYHLNRPLLGFTISPCGAVLLGRGIGTNMRLGSLAKKEHLRMMLNGCHRRPRIVNERMVLISSKTYIAMCQGESGDAEHLQCPSV